MDVCAVCTAVTIVPNERAWPNSHMCLRRPHLWLRSQCNVYLFLFFILLSSEIQLLFASVNRTWFFFFHSLFIFFFSGLFIAVVFEVSKQSQVNWASNAIQNVFSSIKKWKSGSYSQWTRQPAARFNHFSLIAKCILLVIEQRHFLSRMTIASELHKAASLEYTLFDIIKST